MVRGKILTVCVGVLVSLVGWSSDAGATLRYGDIQISGNFQTQNLFRTPDVGSFDLVQQRNTFRLQYEHRLVTRGKLLGGEVEIPGVKDVNFFAYYRGVYDGVYDIAPGPFLRAGDNSRAGKIGDVPGGDRSAVAFENVLREVFLDVDTNYKVSFRIGRQQIVWGEALNFRALDSANALDLSWHLIWEAGLFGKVGFDELRIPAWAIKALWDVGSIGPLSNVFVEAYDIPFDFQPTELKFNPAPWSFPLRDPFRAGLTLDLATQAIHVGGVVLPPNTLPAGLLLVQPCFDRTGNTQPNGEASPDFSSAPETGFCDTPGLQRSSIRQGIYDRRDPTDVNQFGFRFGASAPLGINFTLAYMYRRSLGPDVPGTINAKAQLGAVTGNPFGFVQLAPHSTTDPITRETTNVVGYLRVPIEFYYPYVHVLGGSFNYFEELTSVVVTGEASLTHGVPIATLDSSGSGINKKDVIHGAIGGDKNVWIRSLNRRSTFLFIAQMNFMHILDHQTPRFDEFGLAIDGDVQAPNAKLIPEQFGGESRTDRLKSWELLSLVAVNTFYKGGSVVPQFIWVNDWANAPAMGFILATDYLPTNDIILTPALRLFTSFGRTVDEPFGLGRSTRYSEIQLKATYQF